MSRPDRQPIHQLVNHLAPGDAIGHDVLTIQSRLRQRGHDSEIFCLHHGPGMGRRSRPARTYPDHSSPENLLIWHFSIGTSLAELAARVPDRVVMRYHNITPARFFDGISPQLALECRLGRRQLQEAAGFVQLGVGDSAFNQAELDGLGYPRTGHCPILLDLDSLRPVKVPAHLAALAQGGPNLLHVGRLMPQKRYEDLIKTFFFFKKIHPQARLLLVGGGEGLERYRASLEELAAELDLADVLFLGRVSGPDLLALYGLASAYLCLSDHEGFCVPLVEAMQMNLPVVAKRSTAVTETLGPAGVLLDDPGPISAAEAVSALIGDPDLRQGILAGQEERLAAFRPGPVWERLWGLLQPLAES